MIAFLALSCAGAEIQSSRRLVHEKEIVKPSVIMVFDFAVSSNDVAADGTGPEFATGTGDAGERQDLGRAVSTLLAESIVEQLEEREIDAVRGHIDMNVPMNALLLKGQFVTVDEGDQMKRVLIGFGAGATEVKVQTQVYQRTGIGIRQISEGELIAEGSKMPGLAVPVGAGAAAGNAMRSAVVAGSMTTIRETLGGLAKDVDNLAEALAERTAKYYKRRGWL
jgi:hypothetical protein